jgi:hypothetical protein
MERPWEAVHTVDEVLEAARRRNWRPQSGVADYGGQPHHYRLLFLDSERWNAEEDWFELIPVSPEAVGWAEECRAILLRYIHAYLAGAAPENAAEERALPEDCARREELEKRFAAELAANKQRAFVVRGKFGPGSRRVRWRPIEPRGPAEPINGLGSE